VRGGRKWPPVTNGYQAFKVLNESRRGRSVAPLSRAEEPIRCIYGTDQEMEREWKEDQRRRNRPSEKLGVYCCTLTEPAPEGPEHARSQIGM
jgi:hypothetical protein